MSQGADHLGVMSLDLPEPTFPAWRKDTISVVFFTGIIIPASKRCPE